jgi:para-nitrobenzyl esterase
VGPAGAEPAAVRPGRRRPGPGAGSAGGDRRRARRRGTPADRIQPRRGTAVLCRARHHRPIDDAALEAAAGAYGLSADSLARYRAGRPGASAGDILAAVITDWFFTIPAIRVAEARAKAASAATWVYRFDHPAPENNHRFGASHGAEVPFVFNTIGQDDLHPLIGDTPSQAVADRTHRAWVDFITHGDPGWPAYDTADRTTGLLSDHIEPASDPTASERACWDQIR